MIEAKLLFSLDDNLLDVTFEDLKCDPSEYCEVHKFETSQRVEFRDDRGNYWIGVFKSGDKGTLDSQQRSVVIVPDSPVALLWLLGNAYWIDVNKREVLSLVHFACDEIYDVRAYLIREKQMLFMASDLFRVYSSKGILLEDSQCCLEMVSYTEDTVHLKCCTGFHWSVRIPEP
jgi:hypothetical protein